jgi:hypothetical protein
LAQAMRLAAPARATSPRYFVIELRFMDAVLLSCWGG